MVVFSLASLYVRLFLNTTDKFKVSRHSGSFLDKVRQELLGLFNSYIFSMNTRSRIVADLITSIRALVNKIFTEIRCIKCKMPT